MKRILTVLVVLVGLSMATGINGLGMSWNQPDLMRTWLDQFYLGIGDTIDQQARDTANQALADAAVAQETANVALDSSLHALEVARESVGAGDTLTVADGFGIASTYNDTTKTLTTSVDTTDTAYAAWVEATGGGGIADAFDVVSMFGASGLDDTTSGAIAQGESALVVADPSSFAVGQGVWVESAMVGRWGMVQTVTRISGDTLFLSDTAEATVTGAMVQHDDTRAIQAGIDSMVAQGGGVLYFPVIGCDGIYNVNDTFSTYNALLHLTKNGTTVTPLVFRGEVPPMNPWTSYTGRSAQIRSWNVTDGAGNKPSVISGGLWGTAADSGQGDNYTEVVFENIGIMTRANSNLSGLNLNNCLYAEVKNCQFRAGDTASLSPQTSPATYGVIMPRRYCGPNLGLFNVAITGFAFGVQAAEHISFNQVFVRYAGLGGIEFIEGHRPNWGLITVETSPCALKFSDGQSDVDLHLNYEINESGDWHTHAGQTILDSSGYARGRIAYAARNANDGAWNADISVTGCDSVEFFNVRQHEHDQWLARTATAETLAAGILSATGLVSLHAPVEFTNQHTDTSRVANNSTSAGVDYVIHAGNTTAGPVTDTFVLILSGRWNGLGGSAHGDVFANTYAGACTLYKSTDGGNTFASMGVTTPGYDDIWSDTAGVLYGAVYGTHAVNKSTNNGATWASAGWSKAGFGACDPTNNALYLLSSDSVRYSTDGGSTWALRSRPFINYNNYIRVAPNGDVYVSGSTFSGNYGVARSTNTGTTWTYPAAPSAVPAVSGWSGLAINTLGYVYLGNNETHGGVWRSTNSGSTWTVFDTIPAWYGKYLNTDAAGNLYTNYPGQYSVGVYRSSNPSPIPNYAGGDLVLQAGLGTGNSTASGLVMKVGEPGASGVTPQDTTTALTVRSTGAQMFVPFMYAGSDSVAVDSVTAATDTVYIWWSTGKRSAIVQATP